jgi:hypothetical protein
MIEKKDKFSSSKLDALQKHIGYHKVVVTIVDVVVDEWFYYKDTSHNKNKRFNTWRGNELVLSLVQFRAHVGSLK